MKINRDPEINKNGNPKELDFSEERIMRRSFSDFYYKEDEIQANDTEEFDLDPILSKDGLFDEYEDFEPQPEDDEIMDEISNDEDLKETYDWLIFCEDESPDIMMFLEKARTRLDRQKTRARKEALTKATKGKWDSWGPSQRAVFLAKFEFKLIGPKRGKFVIRKNPRNVGDVKKQLKKKSKLLKKLMRSKGASIRKKAQRIRARGEK